jgi:hypothetical protein
MSVHFFAQTRSRQVAELGVGCEPWPEKVPSRLLTVTEALRSLDDKAGTRHDTARLFSSRVYGTMRDIAGRNAEQCRRLAALGVEIVELDRTDATSVNRGAAKILDAAAGLAESLLQRLHELRPFRV